MVKVMYYKLSAVLRRLLKMAFFSHFFPELALDNPFFYDKESYTLFLYKKW